MPSQGKFGAMTLPDTGIPRRGNSSDSLRRRNLSLVLTLVHHGRSRSRSQLTMLTGLNRSTIAALVAELTQRGLVVEAEANPNNRVGRPSPLVQPASGPVALAVNPEIDAITVGVVGLGGRMLRRIRHDVERVPSVAESVHAATAIIDSLRPELDGAHRTVGIGVALPGLVRSRDGLVRLAPHLGWTDEPFAELLEESTGYPVSAANDASLGANAERIFGAGRGIRDLVYLNGGASGVGGGIIAGGLPLGGVEGYAGEFGHTLVTGNHARDAAGSQGSLELEVNRAALLAAVGLTAAGPDELEAALLASSSPVVLNEVLRQLEFLGVALRNAVDILNPELIVLGGFLGSLIAVAPGRLDAFVTEHALAAPRACARIARAELGSDVLMIGAAELAFQSLLTDPGSYRE
jgi:predicted NBD/HSP70 family sugar kinase